MKPKSGSSGRPQQTMFYPTEVGARHRQLPDLGQPGRSSGVVAAKGVRIDGKKRF